jgi:DNA helicase INO80
VIIGEGHFDDGSNRPSGAATPIPAAGDGPGPKGKKPRKNAAAGGKKAKTAKQRLAMADGDVDMG